MFQRPPNPQSSPRPTTMRVGRGGHPRGLARALRGDHRHLLRRLADRHERVVIVEQRRWNLGGSRETVDEELVWEGKKVEHGVGLVEREWG